MRKFYFLLLLILSSCAKKVDLIVHNAEVYVADLQFNKSSAFAIKDGFFVEVGEGFQGMLHSSQMKLPEGVEDHLGHFKEGEEVEARVASVIKEKISLTQLSQEEMAAEEEVRTKGLSTGTFVYPELPEY